MNKIILLDSSVFVHKAIFSWDAMMRLKRAGKLGENSFIPPVAYTYFSMIISALTKINVEKDDILIMAQDGRDSWRKDYYADYKAQRKEFRESHEGINWEQKYGEITAVIDQLKLSKMFYWIQINKIEADDIIAVAAKYFEKQEVIIVSIDKDLEQLAFYPNVKIYSLLAKYKSAKGAYKLITNPLKIITDKAKKGDVSDNILVDKEHDTPEDYELREYIINLLRLPDFVTETVKHYLEDLKPQEIIHEELPYQSSLALKVKNIYDVSKKIYYEDVILYQENKEKRVKNRKAKLKAQAKGKTEPKVSLR